MKKCPFQKYESSPSYHKYAGSFMDCLGAECMAYKKPVIDKCGNVKVEAGCLLIDKNPTVYR